MAQVREVDARVHTTARGGCTHVWPAPPVHPRPTSGADAASRPGRPSPSARATADSSGTPHLTATGGHCAERGPGTAESIAVGEPMATDVPPRATRNAAFATRKCTDCCYPDPGGLIRHQHSQQAVRVTSA